MQARMYDPRIPQVMVTSDGTLCDHFGAPQTKRRKLRAPAPAAVADGLAHATSYHHARDNDKKIYWPSVGKLCHSIWEMNMNIRNEREY